MYLNVNTLSRSAGLRHGRKPALRIQPRPFFTLLALSCLLLFTATMSQAQQNNTIGTVAGGAPTNLVATLAAIPNPTGVAEDASGNLYIASQYSYYVYKVNPSTGALSILAGNGFFGFSGVPVRVLSTRSSAFVRELAASLSLSVFLSDSLRGMMRLLLFVFGGPNPSE